LATHTELSVNDRTSTAGKHGFNRVENASSSLTNKTRFRDRRGAAVVIVSSPLSPAPSGHPACRIVAEARAVRD